MADFEMPNEDQLIGLAKEWAENRKPPALCLELFTRLVQLTAYVFHMAAKLGVKLPVGELPPPNAAASDATQVGPAGTVEGILHPSQGG
jgi:hypothetical protein